MYIGLQLFRHIFPQLVDLISRISNTQRARESDSEKETRERNKERQSDGWAAHLTDLIPKPQTTVLAPAASPQPPPLADDGRVPPAARHRDDLLSLARIILNRIDRGRKQHSNIIVRVRRNGDEILALLRGVLRSRSARGHCPLRRSV